MKKHRKKQLLERKSNAELGAWFARSWNIQEPQYAHICKSCGEEFLAHKFKGRKVMHLCLLCARLETDPFTGEDVRAARSWWATLSTKEQDTHMRQNCYLYGIQKRSRTVNEVTASDAMMVRMWRNAGADSC